jgi:hypothetical protein
MAIPSFLLPVYALRMKGRSISNMAEFIQKANVKRSVRDITTPIPDVATLNTLVQGAIDTNAFQCVDFIRSGITVPGMTRGTESYTVKVIYEDVNAKNVGNTSARARTVAGLNAAATAILADSALSAAIGGTAIRDSENESYSVSIKCHDPNGEDYTVTFTRKTITVSTYEDNAIVTRVNTWANTKPSLA